MTCSFLSPHCLRIKRYMAVKSVNDGHGKDVSNDHELVVQGTNLLVLYNASVIQSRAVRAATSPTPSLSLSPCAREHACMCVFVCAWVRARERAL